MRYSNGSFDEILLESGLVSQFLADAHPSHLLPASGSSPTAPLFRYRVNFFVDTYFTKVNTYLYAVIRTTNDEEKKTKADEWVKAIEKEIEPLLHDANPFFGGSKEMTLAEVFFLSTVSLELHIACYASTALTPPSSIQVQTASFILRLYDFADDIILPSSLPKALDKLPNFSKWAKACITHNSVTYIWDKELRRQNVRDRLPQARERLAKQDAKP
jgi:glutathione S-transferase